jgi:hypothetical protein
VHVAIIILAVLVAADQDFEDEVDPRAPGKPLTVVFRPYYCAQCVKEERIDAESKPLRMMRLPVAEIAGICGVKKNWFAIATPHFKILSNLRGAKIRPGKTRFGRADIARLKSIFPKLNPRAAVLVLNAHERAHLYHIRVERIYSHFAALTANEKPWLGMKAPYELYLFRRYRQHHALVDRFIGRRNDQAGVQHHIRTQPNFMMYTTAEELVPGPDRALGNHVVHNVAHNLLDGYGNYYRETWAWLEEGLAHYYERRETPDHNTFCWTEGKRPSLFLRPEWESTIHSLVRRGKDTLLTNWTEKVQPGELTAVEQGLSWSIVRWMVETEPLRFARLVEKCQDYKNKPSGSECIEFAFGVPVTEVHRRWREHVLKEYAR